MYSSPLPACAAAADESSKEKLGSIVTVASPSFFCSADVPDACAVVGPVGGLCAADQNCRERERRDDGRRDRDRHGLVPPRVRRRRVGHGIAVDLKNSVDEIQDPVVLNSRARIEATGDCVLTIQPGGSTALSA